MPLTICDYDAQGRTVSFAFHEVGKTTKELGTFEQGDGLFNVTGPLGNPSEIRRFGRVLCVGGSIMIAPLLLQVKGDEGGREPRDDGARLPERRVPVHEGGGHGLSATRSMSPPTTVPPAKRDWSS